MSVSQYSLCMKSGQRTKRGEHSVELMKRPKSKYWYSQLVVGLCVKVYCIMQTDSHSTIRKQGVNAKASHYQ